MAWTQVSVPGATPSVGAYSPAIRAGDHIFMSGQVPIDPDSGAVIGHDIATQTNAVLDRLEQILAAAGASLSDVVSITAYLADIAHWNEFNATYRSRFSAPYPARTTIGAQLHGVLVEITAVAYAPR